MPICLVLRNLSNLDPLRKDLLFPSGRKFVAIKAGSEVPRCFAAVVFKRRLPYATAAYYVFEHDTRGVVPSNGKAPGFVRVERIVRKSGR